jgi:hypothetical protein
VVDDLKEPSDSRVLSDPRTDNPMSVSGTISCVVDEKPRFHFDALRWYASLTRVAGVDPSDLVVHVVGDRSSAQLRYLKSRGVSIRGVELFDARHPHCNKVSGALNLAQSSSNGLIVLTDTDLAFVEDPRAVEVPGHGIASRLVSWAVPTVEVFARIFEEAQLELPPIIPLEWPEDALTVAGNGNGGLYLVPGEILPQVANGWERWSRWLLERLDLFGQVKRRGLDQVAMVMALTSEGLGWAQLDPRWNSPMRFWRGNPNPIEPAGIHYHTSVNGRGEIMPTNFPVVDRCIDRVNEAIRDVWREAGVSIFTR